ncbi:collagen alpha-2(I) chain-like isoform X2 [Planococcus citri]
MIISVVIGKIVFAQEEPSTPTVAAKNISSSENTRNSTCLDILKKDPNVKDGLFMINPMTKYEDDEYSEFPVWCDFSRNETVVYPLLKDSKIRVPTDVSTARGEVWIENIGMEIYYPFDNSQIKILQETSRWCYQNITIKCKNLVAFYDAVQNTLDKSIKILAWNDKELTPLGPLDLKLESAKDDCKYRDNSNEWKETVIEYSTTRCERLPFADVAIRDGGRGHGQWFNVEMGPVRFSW